MKSFIVNLDLSDTEIESDFRQYLEKLRLSDEAVGPLVQDFQLSVLPRLSGIRDLYEKGSNVELQKTLSFGSNEVSIELDTNQPTVAERFKKLFGW